MHPSSAKLKPSLFARTFLSSSFGSEMWQDHRLLESFTWHLIHGHSNCNQDGFAKAQIYQNLSAKTSPSWKINTKHSSNCKNIISLFTLLINPPFSGSFFSSTNQRRLKQVYLQPPPCHETSAVLCLFTTQLCSTKLQPGRCFSRDDELILPGILVMIITMRMRMRRGWWWGWGLGWGGWHSGGELGMVMSDDYMIDVFLVYNDLVKYHWDSYFCLCILMFVLSWLYSCFFVSAFGVSHRSDTAGSCGWNWTFMIDSMCWDMLEARSFCGETFLASICIWVFPYFGYDVRLRILFCYAVD